MKKETVLPNLISTYIQNWLAKPAILLGSVILLTLFFQSCEEPIEVVGDLVPGADNTEIRFVEFPLVVNHASFDSSIVSTNALDGSRGQIFVGHQNDPEIGDFTAEGYFGVILDGTFNRSSVLPTATAIRTRLYMNFNYFYGDEFESPQIFKLHQLEEPVSRTGTEYKLSDRIAKGQLVSEDSAIVVIPSDTLENFIPLRNQFGRELLLAVRDTSLSTLELYEAIKGFNLSAESGTNNLQALNIAGGESYLEIIYRNFAADTVHRLTFDLSASSFTATDFQAGTLFPADFSNNRSFELTDPNKAYFNNLLGISPRIDLEPYFNFIDTVDYLQINRAELVIASDEYETVNTISDQKRPIQNMVPYIMNGNGLIDKVGEDFRSIQANFNLSGGVADQSGGGAPLNLVYNSNRQTIQSDISFFLQAIYNSSSFWEQDQSLLFTGQFIRRNRTPFIETAKINLGNFDNFLVDKENITLRIYYTTFK